MNLEFQLSNHGFEVREQACSASLLHQLQSELPLDAPDDEALLDHSPTVQREATSGTFLALAESALGEGCFPTHAILYSSNNTAQPWHQQTKIKVSGQGFIEAADHTIFNRLICVRVTIDDCAFFDGGLKLCPTSHKHGVLTPNQVRGHSIRPFSSPELKAGDVLLLHPLTIQSNDASKTGKPRRVIHIVYAVAE